MLDSQYIRDNLDAVKANCKNRNVNADVDRVVALADERKRLMVSLDKMTRRRSPAFAMIR